MHVRRLGSATYVSDRDGRDGVAYDVVVLPNSRPVMPTRTMSTCSDTRVAGQFRGRKQAVMWSSASIVRLDTSPDSESIGMAINDSALSSSVTDVLAAVWRWNGDAISLFRPADINLGDGAGSGDTYKDGVVTTLPLREASKINDRGGHWLEPEQPRSPGAAARRSPS